MACGFTQIFGVNYYNTFLPVAKLASFHSVLALAARFDWDIKSFDFNSAYLNSKLDEDEEIYMQAPPRYEGQGEHSIKRLKKSLYGVKLPWALLLDVSDLSVVRVLDEVVV